MKNKINCLDLINSLLYLKIVLKEMDKISIVKDLEINNEPGPVNGKYKMGTRPGKYKSGARAG